jgi:L-alanine-DL-glutamate epimerase-like enolase superfamily enzyme
MQEPEPLADHLQMIRAEGFRAFKIGWGPFGRRSLSLDEQMVRAARDAIGPTAKLMVDAGGSDALWHQGLKWAMRTSEMLTAYDVDWFEEPLCPDNVRDYKALRKRSTVPIAGGEVFTRRQSFASWIQAGALDVVQPDVTKVGGISEERRIAWMAEDNGLRFVPHGWNTALGLAADLHLASATKYSDMIEYLTGSPFIDEIVQERWKLDDDGMLPIPDSPGLGISLDFDKVEKYTGTRFKDGQG